MELYSSSSQQGYEPALMALRDLGVEDMMPQILAGTTMGAVQKAMQASAPSHGKALAPLIDGSYNHLSVYS